MAVPIAFSTPEGWWQWLSVHHADAKEVWVLFYKKGSGIASIDWQQAVVEALAWGWIDGVRHSVDALSWKQRYTPRRAGSAWSAINRSHAEALMASGRMQPSGLAQVEIARANGRWEAPYSGGKGAEIPADFLAAVAAASPLAQQTFAALDSRNRFALYYRLTTAKRAETRVKRSQQFLALLAEGKTIL